MVGMAHICINLERRHDVSRHDVEIWLSRCGVGYKVESFFFDVFHFETGRDVSTYGDFKSAKAAYMRKVGKYLKQAL